MPRAKKSSAASRTKKISSLGSETDEQRERRIANARAQLALVEKYTRPEPKKRRRFRPRKHVTQAARAAFLRTRPKAKELLGKLKDLGVGALSGVRSLKPLAPIHQNVWQSPLPGIDTSPRKPYTGGHLVHLVVHEDRPPTVAAVVALAPPAASRSRGSGGAAGKIIANSYQRYNGGVRVKRQYGSSTVTKFYVYRAEDKDDPSKWMKLDGYGRTPGDRKTDAIRRSGLAR